MTEKAELIGLNKAELDRLMADIGEKPFRAKQLYQWLYVQGAVSFDEMTNLSKDLRAKLADKFTITRPKIVAEQLSRDKTHKWLLEFADGQRIETVYIRCKSKAEFVQTDSVFFIRLLKFRMFCGYNINPYYGQR